MLPDLRGGLLGGRGLLMCHLELLTRQSKVADQPPTLLRNGVALGPRACPSSSPTASRAPRTCSCSSWSWAISARTCVKTASSSTTRAVASDAAASASCVSAIAWRCACSARTARAVAAAICSAASLVTASIWASAVPTAVTCENATCVGNTGSSARHTCTRELCGFVLRKAG
ncbi:MAG: hypothetical protein IPM90_02150 [Austwickia sp.]|nr:hypothetical protein [Austwickia sp.]